MDLSQEHIITEMQAREDWMDKYEYLISLGEQLRPMDPALVSEDTAIGGCQSHVWIAAETINGRMRFQGDSDAKITRGILAVVLSIVDGRSPADVAGMDFICLRKIGLSSSLSPSRAEGLAAIISRVRELGARSSSE